jgi:hypothetical protein
VRSARYESIRENLGSEVDLVNTRHVILKPHYIVDNPPPSFADRVVADRSGSGQAHSIIKMPVRKEASMSIRLLIYTNTPIQINS